MVVGRCGSPARSAGFRPHDPVVRDRIAILEETSRFHHHLLIVIPAVGRWASLGQGETGDEILRSLLGGGVRSPIGTYWKILTRSGRSFIVVRSVSDASVSGTAFSRSTSLSAIASKRRAISSSRKYGLLIPPRGGFAISRTLTMKRQAHAPRPATARRPLSSRSCQPLAPPARLVRQPGRSRSPGARSRESC